MIREINIIYFFILILTIISCNQRNNNIVMLGETNARNELRIALAGNTHHNVINQDSIIIKDKETAIHVVEPILFFIYSKENIIKQRPYETWLIDKYWVISGTLAEGYLGGTFLIIMDATNAKIIRLTHGK